MRFTHAYMLAINDVLEISLQGCCPHLMTLHFEEAIGDDVHTVATLTMSEQLMRAIDGERLSRCYLQKIERELINKKSRRRKTHIRKCTLETDISKLLLLDFILSVESPNMIVVVMISLKEKLEIQM